ncbi:transcriptional regulator [Purpureocillium lilacinum]|uniref:Transcriptional regulator n=1 Tax=Purpureocillium lilacinum TaxID=33203 RepID=A0A179GRH1_PURLI|nr:transcriptional regulator [Purpureocillium lilacinum]
MRATILSALALAGAALAMQRRDSVLEANPNKQSKMPVVMGLKTSNFQQKQDAGLFDPGRYKIQEATKCQGGKAGEYSCKNVDLLGHLTHETMGSQTRAGNDIWGWTHTDGREFAIVGQTDGVAFIEVLKNGTLRYLGRLPTQTGNAIWRDIKVLNNHAYIVADAYGHGLQVFNLTKLLAVGSEPKTFSKLLDLAAWYVGFGSAHNVVVNAESQTVFVVGAGKDGLDGACKGLAGAASSNANSSSNGGLIMLDARDPAKPKLTGCAGQDGYVHDALAVTYQGADTRYHGREIVFGCNEDTLTIYDVTDRAAPLILSKTTYDGFNGTGAYTHQAWPVDGPSLTHLLLDDELDEEHRAHQPGGNGDAHTTTYVFDVRDLTAPRWTGRYKAPVKSVDHNQYVRDGLSYMANYGSGLRVVDVSGVVADPSGRSMREVAHFDCFPDDDAEGGKPEFNGAWTAYPFFASGTVLLNCIERGVFALKVNRGAE